MITTKALAVLIADVPEKGTVYFKDLDAIQTADKARAEQGIAPDERPARERAIDGVAYHVFNSLRGVEDTVEGATFADVRAIVVEWF